MIEKLTKAQEKKIPVYLNKWLNLGLRTKSVDRKKATKAIYFLYEKIMKIDKPKYVLFLDSPMACQLAFNLIKNTKFDEQLDSQLSSQLRSQLDSQLDSQLSSQLRSQLDSQLGSQLDSQLRSQLRSQLESQELEYSYQYWISLWFCGGYYGLYDYVLHELFPKEKPKFKLFKEFIELWPELHYLLVFKDIVFVSDFPKEINRNELNQLHKDGGPALLYRDTYSLHRLNGVNVSKEIAEAKPEQITKEMILKEENADVRREIIRKVGIAKAIDILGAETIDTYKSKVGGTYKLLSIDYDGRGKRPFLQMTNPSIGTVHIEGVKPGITTVKDALCFRNGLDKFSEPKELT